MLPILAGLVVINLIFKPISNDEFNRGLATLMATNPHISAFGDGAHAVPITPQAAISVGQLSILEDLHVTVSHAGAAEDTAGLRITPEDYQYWVIEFTLENISSKTIYPHPIVDAQMQYRVHEEFSWEPDHGGDCVPSVRKGVPPLEPQAKFECQPVYLVPHDNQPLYWVFERHGDFRVFQVR
ncbi:MAG TPA: hypothetical protein VLG46_06820 [Anaerolineae bacterium]|nr:hypothetical protein [Anaerolineae bacterium]